MNCEYFTNNKTIWTIDEMGQLHYKLSSLQHISWLTTVFVSTLHTVAALNFHPAVEKR